MLELNLKFHVGEMNLLEKDIGEKTLIGYPDVFAGIVNAFFKIESWGDKAIKIARMDTTVCQ